MDRRHALFRSELKFLVDEHTLQIMERKLSPVLYKDLHQVHKAYRVRSIYFDTYTRKAYRENDAGVEERKKFRIRVYDNPKNAIRLEVKQKLKDRNYKESCYLTIAQFEAIMNRTLRHDKNFPKALNLLYLELYTRFLAPSVIVEYERSAYTHQTNNVRVTFDRNISFSYEFDKFLEDELPKATPLLPLNKHIFEIKYDGALPDFIAQAIETGQLERTTFSKFYFSHLRAEGEEIRC
jgi:hypothetical protein